ncbi:DMT family transporter [Alkalicoccobacillus murimartini]|uniref:Multidrug transporter EmrE-like cation transporter n=1 Tax=Alkalicoccobacillus murimartini TaxID=171685 RepID=A0ABT9YFH9_9BACI|nr:multidrug efflux SMR transporter [Alkalicoccobacillus murimartini]MDQ0206582.1 multidrug transporter EmrE-like cation transporter [Alkalicoccobacillus murimartini]
MNIYSVYLVSAIFFGVNGQIALNYSAGFTQVGFTIYSLVCYFIAFSFLSLAVRGIPLSIAYAIWGGTGAALSIFIGRFLFGESLSFIKFLALFMIVFGIVFLHVTRRFDSENKKAPKIGG